MAPPTGAQPTADATNDDLTEILIRRKRKHARAQANSTARRKARNAPRRDDLARAAYYVLLLTIEEADKRADLDLHVGLLAEYEVTKLVTMVSAITDHLGIITDADEEVGELEQNVAPNAVLDEIERSNAS